MRRYFINLRLIVMLGSNAQKLLETFKRLDTDNHRHKARGVLQLLKLCRVNVEQWLLRLFPDYHRGNHNKYGPP